MAERFLFALAILGETDFDKPLQKAVLKAWDKYQYTKIGTVLKAPSEKWRLTEKAWEMIRELPVCQVFKRPEF